MTEQKAGQRHTPSVCRDDWRWPDPVDNCDLRLRRGSLQTDNFQFVRRLGAHISAASNHRQPLPLRTTVAAIYKKPPPRQSICCFGGLRAMTFPSNKEVLQPVLVGRLEREVVNHSYALGG